MTERLREELEAARRELKAHMASWEYAFAHAAGPNSGREHPTHQRTRALTAELQNRVRDLQARVAEHEL
jgi:hypothetical protein